MREILFRGRRIDNGEWVEGGYYIEPYTDKTFILQWNSFGLGFMDAIEVDCTTIGQYTGLTDKNGRRIFEGDIVHMKGGCVSGFGAVEFRNGSFGIADAKRKRFYLMDDHSVYRVEGNIHDNPELLNGGVENGRF